VRQIAILAFLLFAALAYAMDSPLGATGDDAGYTEIIIRLKPGVVIAPESAERVPADTITVTSNALSELNNKYGLISVESLFEDKKESRGASGLENVYLFRFPGGCDTGELLRRYNGLDAVIYAEQNSTMTIY